VGTRVKDALLVALTLGASVIYYVGRKETGWFGVVKLSSTQSVIITILLGLSLVYILIRTVQGHPVGRRVVFLYVGIAVALPFLMTIHQTIWISPEVRAAYDDVRQLPKGSKVLVSFDYDPPSAPELQPMAVTFIRYCLAHDLKVIVMGLWPQGPQQANLAIDEVLADTSIARLNLKYGVDYVNLGFQTGNEFVIQRMGTRFVSMFPVDYRGTPYADLPLVADVTNFGNIDYSFNLSAGYPGTKEWVQVGVGRYGLKLSAGNTAVQAPEVYPYYRAGQLRGLLGGMNGAAEFETLTGYIGQATMFMNSQSFAHMTVIAFIIIGNVAFFRGGRKSRL
jgi:hypothetical protein